MEKLTLLAERGEIEPFACDCSIIFTNQKMMWNHIRNFCPESLKFCKKCGEYYKKKDEEKHNAEDLKSDPERGIWDGELFTKYFSIVGCAGTTEEFIRKSGNILSDFCYFMTGTRRIELPLDEIEEILKNEMNISMSLPKFPSADIPEIPDDMQVNDDQMIIQMYSSIEQIEKQKKKMEFVFFLRKIHRDYLTFMTELVQKSSIYNQFRSNIKYSNQDLYYSCQKSMLCLTDQSILIYYHTLSLELSKAQTYGYPPTKLTEMSEKFISFQ